MPQMLQVLRERAIGMLTAGISTCSRPSRLQKRFWEFGSTPMKPHNRRPCGTTPAQDLHIQHLHLQDRLRPATRTTAVTIGLHNQIISAQTVRNHLREAHLHARFPHLGLDLTAVCRRNRIEWANAHIWWCLALWRGDLFMDESRFSLYRANGRQCVWCRVGERFADVNIVDRVGPWWRWGSGMGRRMLWTTNTGAFYWCHFLNAQRYRDEILRLIVMPFIHDHHLMLPHDNAGPHVARICSQFLEAENIPVLAWPAYSPDMCPIEHVWDALDWRIRQHVPVPANIQHLRTAIEEEWTNIPQATINILINSMWRRCAAVCEANGGHTRYRLVFRPILFSIYRPCPKWHSKPSRFFLWPCVPFGRAHSYALIPTKGLPSGVRSSKGWRV